MYVPITTGYTIKEIQDFQENKHNTDHKQVFTIFYWVV